jgi:hypothetical protein
MMCFLHHFVRDICVYFPPCATPSWSSAFVLRDGQANRPTILDVPDAAVNGLLSCVCLDHRSLRYARLRTYLLRVDMNRSYIHIWWRYMGPSSYILSIMCIIRCGIISKKHDRKHISSWQRVSVMNYFRPRSSASLITFWVMKLKK